MKQTVYNFQKQGLALLLFLLCGITALQAQTVPSPQQTDQIITDPNANGKADPGDKIRYKVTIQNTGSSNATGVKVNAVPDARTTLDLASFRTSPLAMPDAYACLGNVGITVPDGASDLLANDYDDNPGGLTITTGTFATTQGGSITIAANGSFTYNPPRGFEGTDTYVYTINDGNAGAGVTATDLGTITFTVSGMIWFINNNAGACASSCDGRMSNPYTSLADFNTVNGLSGGLDPADNDNIFIYESATAYTGGIVLRSGQKLFGQDATATLAAMTGLTPPTFSNALPITNSASPFASITNSGGDGVTLNAGNTLRGFRVGDCLDFGIENSGTTSVGNLTVSEVTINNGTGGGFDASHGSGTMNAVFDGISSTGGVNGINLVDAAGTFNGGTGTITNPSGTAVALLNGSVAFSYAGTITDNTGFAVDIDNHDSGNATLSGNITSTGTGIRVQNCGGGTKTFSGSSKTLNTGMNTAITLSNNTGAIINLNNGLNLTTTTAMAFSATGGGTISAGGGGGPTSTITTTTGTGLILQDVSISGTNFQFASIASTSGQVANLTNIGGAGLKDLGRVTTSSNTITALNLNNAGTVNIGGISSSSLTTSSADAIVINSSTLRVLSPGVNITTTGVGKGVNATGGTVAITTGIGDSDGGLRITTSGGIGFNATSGGTVSLTGTGINTISSTTGTAFNMANTTIGGSGITFQSISKNGGTNNAIALSSTGAGAFSVTGTGSAGSGGTLQNISGADAVSLNTTGGLVSLQYMVIQDISHPDDATDALQTHSGVDAIHGRAVSGGLTLTNSTIQRISDNAINGTVDASPVTGNPTNTTWSGLTLTNCTFQNTNRFNVASKGDANNESAIIIWGVSGTVSVTGNTFQNCSSGIDFVTHTSGTLDMIVQSNTFNTLYKEISTNSVGRFGISVVQEGTLTSTVRIGDWQNETNAALGNTFTNAGNLVAIRVISNTTAFGNLKALIAKNTFTVTDHSSPGQAPGNLFYNFPQSGVLLRHVGNVAFPGGGNFESIVAANTFNECMHADGGLGNVSVIMEKGSAETIIRNNTFNKPWDLPMELRSDGQSNTQTSNQILVTGNTHIDGIVGDGTTDLGGQSPYGSTYVQVRNNGRMDLTMRDEATPLGLTDPASSTGTVSLFTQTTTAGDILNIFLNNIQGPRGYRLSHAAGSSYNLFRNGSGSGTAQGVLQDNNVRGGGGVDNTNPPTVTTTGTITLTNTAPVLPNI